MSAAAVIQAELFPVLEEKVRKRSPLWHYLKATAHHGPLASPAMVAASIGVSRQRVQQFMSEGRLDAVEVDGRKFIPARKLEEFLLVSRKNGLNREFQTCDRFGEYLERLRVA